MSELGIRATFAPVPRALGSHSRGGSDGRGPAGLLPASSTTFDVGDALTELMKLSSALGEELANGSRNAAVTAASARKGASEKRTRALESAMEAARKAAEAKSRAMARFMAGTRVDVNVS